MNFFDEIVAVTNVYRESLGLPVIPRYKVVGDSSHQVWFIWDEVTREHVRSAYTIEKAQRMCKELNEGMQP